MILYLHHQIEDPTSMTLTPTRPASPALADGDYML